MSSQVMSIQSRLFTRIACRRMQAPPYLSSPTAALLRIRLYPAKANGLEDCRLFSLHIPCYFASFHLHFVMIRYTSFWVIARIDPFLIRESLQPLISPSFSY